MRRLTIGIDGYNLAIPKGTGVASYAFNLAKAAAALGASVEGVFGIDVGSDPTLFEVLFFERFVSPSKPRRRRLRWIHNAFAPERPRLVEVPLTRAVAKQPLADRFPTFDRLHTAARLFEGAHQRFQRSGQFTKLTLPDPPQIMHWTYPVPVLIEGARNVYTIHDLVPLLMPYTTLDEKRVYRDLVAACVERGDHICTVSERSRADIIGLLHADPEHVTNTYQISSFGDDEIAEIVAGARALAKGVFGLPHRGFFLYFGAIEPKKNVGRLIEAYFASKTTAPLVIAAGRSWRAGDEEAMLDRAVASTRFAKDGKRVIRLEFLPRRQLASLIAAARAVTFPSLYEGFGLPVHEAMLLGTPVLTSTAGSIPEIAGGAAVSVDPYQVREIADAIDRIDGDKTLRAHLAEAGLRQAARFSPSVYAERLRALYGKVFDGRPLWGAVVAEGSAIAEEQSYL